MFHMGDRDSNLTSRDVSAAARAHQSGEHNGGTQSRWGREVEHGGESRIDPFQDDLRAILYAFCQAENGRVRRVTCAVGLVGLSSVPVSQPTKYLCSESHQENAPTQPSTTFFSFSSIIS
jgi:hypothetical protein